MVDGRPKGPAWDAPLATVALSAAREVFLHSTRLGKLSKRSTSAQPLFKQFALTLFRALPLDVIRRRSVPHESPSTVPGLLWCRRQAAISDNQHVG